MNRKNNEDNKYSLGEYDYLFKILLVGDYGVGKTSLIARFEQNAFSEIKASTLGIDYRIKFVEIGGKRVKLQIWDTIGQDRFRKITKSYFLRTHGILIVYDMTEEQSFTSLDHWISEIKANAPQNVNLCVVGNKVDVTSGKVVDYESGKAVAENLNASFFETSAKSSQNVENTFISLATNIKSRIDNENISYNNNNNADEHQKSGFLDNYCSIQ